MTTLRRLWCRAFHRKTLWPIHGTYICAVCKLVHPAWESEVVR